MIGSESIALSAESLNEQGLPMNEATPSLPGIAEAALFVLVTLCAAAVAGLLVAAMAMHPS